MIFGNGRPRWITNECGALNDSGDSDSSNTWFFFNDFPFRFLPIFQFGAALVLLNKNENFCSYNKTELIVWMNKRTLYTLLTSNVKIGTFWLCCLYSYEQITIDRDRNNAVSSQCRYCCQTNDWQPWSEHVLLYVDSIQVTIHLFGKLNCIEIVFERNFWGFIFIQDFHIRNGRLRGGA